MAGRAEIEIVASDSKLASGLLRARAKVNEWAASIASRTGKLMSGAMAGAKWINKKSGFGDSAKDAVSFAGGNLISAGIGKLTDAAEGVRDFERGLVRFQITANKTPAAMNEMRDSIRAASRATGIGTSQILEGAQAYLDITGDVEGAGRAVGKFARIAQASDSQMGDIANAAAAMQDAMKISPDDLEAVFSGLINQGKAGAVTLKNMAGEFPSLLSKFARFGVTGKDGVVELGAMFQVVRKGFGSAEEASTGLQAMMAGTIKHADRFAKAGVQIFNVGKDGTKSLRPMSQIIDEIGHSQLAKDPQLLNKAFGRGEGEQAYQMLKGHVDMLRQMEEAGQDAGVVQRDLASFIESDAGRIDRAFNRVKVALAEIFTPERITSFTNAIEGLADRIGTVADGVGKVGEAYGKLYGLGRSIRGQFEGPNEFVQQGVEDIEKARNASGPAEKRLYTRKVVNDALNARGYDRAVQSITDAEVNERSSPESMRRALYARFNHSGINGAQNLGEYAAGQRYLSGAGHGDTADQQALLDKSIGDTVKGQTDAIAKTLTDGMARQKSIEELVKQQTDAITKALTDGLAQMPPARLHLGDDHVAASVSRAKGKLHP